MKNALILIACVLLLSPFAAHAVRLDEMLSDPTLEARARTIGAELRCLVCQNESIDESDAPLAHDLRVLIRARLVAGDTDTQAKQYVVARYGDYVLLKPPFKPSTAPLWLGPILLFVVAVGMFALFFRHRLTTVEASEEPDLDQLVIREDETGPQSQRERDR